MAVRSPYCPPPPPATPPAPVRQFKQELPPGLALGGFPPSYHPKAPHGLQAFPQCSTATVGGPQYLGGGGVRLWAPPPPVADFCPPATALQYPHPGLHPQQAFHHPPTGGNGSSGNRTFRRKRVPVPNEPPARCPALAGEASAAAHQQTVTSQQPSLPAASPLPREAYDVYRYIEGELEAIAQREKEFARYIQSVEAKANSGRRPPAGSLSAMMQSLADKTAHLARCFEAYTRELACTDEGTGEVGDSDAMVEMIVDTPMPSPPDSTDGREPTRKAAGAAAPGVGEVVAPAGQPAAAMAGITGAAARKLDKDFVATQRSNNPAPTSSPTPASAAITLAEDLIKLAVTPAPRLHLGPTAVQTVTSTDAAESRKKVVAPPVDPKRARPDALPFPLPEFSPFWELAFESASAPARLVEDELYFCAHR